MSSLDWMRARAPQAPESLMHAVQSTIIGSSATGEPGIDALIGASGTLLDRVLSGPERSRTTALELLAADAAMTWAFELAGEDPSGVDALAERSYEMIAAVARAAVEREAPR